MSRFWGLKALVAAAQQGFGWICSVSARFRVCLTLFGSLRGTANARMFLLPAHVG